LIAQNATEPSKNEMDLQIYLDGEYITSGAWRK